MRNLKLLLKVLLAVLFSFVQVVGMIGVARSQLIPARQFSQTEETDRLIQQLKLSDPKMGAGAAHALVFGFG